MELNNFNDIAAPDEDEGAATVSSVFGKAAIQEENDIWMDVKFYSQLKEYLRTGEITDSTLASNRKDFLIQRAKHYRLENGEVMYGNKIVIIEPDERKRIMSSVHINPKTGIHSGAQRMFSELRQHFYWRSMYVEIVKFVRACPECTEPHVLETKKPEAKKKSKAPLKKASVAPVKREQQAQSIQPSTSETVIQDKNPVLLPKKSPIMTLATIKPALNQQPVWNLLELKLMRIKSPVESTLNQSENLLLSLADPVSQWMDVVLLSPEDMVPAAVRFLMSHCSVLGFAKFHIVGFLHDERHAFVQLFVKNYLDLTKKVWPHEIMCNSEICAWVQQILSSFELSDLQGEIIKYRFDPQSQLGGISPAEKVLGRKVELPFSEVHSLPESVPVLEDSPDPTTVEQICADLDDEAVKAVQAHMSETKEERRKRGSYVKLTMDVKRAITIYAHTHGSLKTAKHFTEKLGIDVSASTVRNITHSFKKLCQKLDQAPEYKTKNGKIVKVPKDQIGQSQAEATASTSKDPPSDAPSAATKRKRKIQTYSPQIRAQIAEYAVEHGNVATVIHFKTNHNIDVKEGTVRAMKNKLIYKKKSHLELLQEHLQTLGNSPRGRPVKLGEHEDTVIKCLKELAERGERMTSYMALTTAKTVIMQRDPELLVENGGTLKLTLEWAKAFIKRLGLKNNA